MHDLVIRGGTVVDGTGGQPFVADVAIDGDRIVAVGTNLGAGREEVDAGGKIVTPGFVDVHTHYDGQATWDQEMAPSSWHGVTTVVMGNCGVGFAPARPDRHDWLIGLMEGVEDIPGTALAEGMTWDWETFPEYMDALEKLPRTIDVACHVPHGAVRAYVLGDREQPGAVPTADDIAEMSRIVEDGLRAGALGFSTSRTVIHKSVDGEVVPGTTATAEELIEIGRAMGRVGYGVFEMASDLNREWNEFDWMGKLSRETGLPVTFAALQSIAKELPLDEQIATMRAENAKGANIVAQIALRGNGIIMAWRGTVHPFRFRPSWVSIMDLPWDEQKARLLDPAFKAQLLSETNDFTGAPQDIMGLLMVVAGGWGMQFEMDEDFDYEPGPEASIAARAAAAGVDPAEYAYDLLCRDDGAGFAYLPILNYADGNLDFLEPLQDSPDTVNSLSDGGAHCGTICDAASPTFMLQHWVRDRKRGGRVPLERAIKRQCRDTAMLYGLEDRGLVAPGYLADLNVIDMDAIQLGKPWLAFDLPAGGKRLLQKADGYVATVKSGVVTFRGGEGQGVYPGGVVRGPQRVEMALAGRMMRGVQLRAPASLDNLTLVDLPDPGQPGPGEIRVRLAASSLNFHDYAVVTGMIPSADGRIPMSDGAGTVEAVGEGVTQFKPGDLAVSLFFPDWGDGAPPTSAFTRVPGDGIDGYAREAVVAPEHWFTRVPDGYSADEAATLTCAGLTAWRALFVDDDIRPGATVLVQGSGGVSVFALQFAKAAGARVIATSSSDAKLERLKALGADELINYKEVPAWGAKAMELTGGRGVDCVVEIGGAGTLDQSMIATKVGGHVALIGVLAGFAGPVQTGLLMAKNLRVQGLTVGSRAQQLDMIAGIEANAIRPVISDHFALDDLAGAFRHQVANKHFGKIGVDI